MKTIRLATLAFLLTTVCLFTACNDNKPSKLLSEKEMVAAGVDFRLAEAYLSKALPAGSSNDSIKDLTAKIYDPILAKYEISLALYRENVSYYMLKPQLMHKIQVAIAEQLRTAADEK